MPKIGKLTIKQWLEVIGTNAGCLKAVWTLFLLFAMPFYATYAFYLLWNWFLADAVHSGVTYWQAGGIFLLLNVAAQFVGHDLENNDRWKGTRVVLAACVPEHKIAAVRKCIVEIDEHNRAVGANMRRLAGLTFAIVFGEVIHAFFM